MRPPSPPEATDSPDRLSVAVETGHRFSVPAGDTILRAGRRAGCWLPFECGWGGCGTCKATLLEGEVRSLLPSAPAIKPQDARRNRILTCQSTPLTDLRLGQVLASSTPRPEFATEELAGILEARQELAPEVFLLRIALDRPAYFQPGQNAIVSVGPDVRRCYSMANAPGEPVIELIVKRFANGLATPALVGLPLASVIHLELPYGGAYLRPPERPLILVAGGTGIAPMMSILRALASAPGSCPPVRVFYGANRPVDLAAGRTVETLVSMLPQAEYVPAVLATDGPWSGATGLVTDVLTARVADPPSHEFYVSGPPIMVRSALALLERASVPISHIHYDPLG